MSDRVSSPSSWTAYARRVIELALRQGDVEGVLPPSEVDQEHGGVFVTLKKFGRLRGCMGLLDSAEPLPASIRHAAVTAALHDPRFPPVGPGELSDLKIDVSILSAPWPMQSIDELQLGVHGVIVRSGMQRGLFLPQVATEHRLSKEEFLSRCCAEKAGLAPDAWKNAAETEVMLFTAEVYKE